MHREVQTSPAQYWPGLVRPFAEDVCLPFLHASQNRDGGWGFTPAAGSSVEPTCWALLALARHEGTAAAALRGQTWLENAQMRNGAWAGYPGSSQGFWLTALAGLVLHTHQRSRQAVRRAARWLCRCLPVEASSFRRICLRLTGSKSAAPFGWGCGDGSMSSIEPTAAALLFLQNLPDDLRPRRAKRRIEYAGAFLRGQLQSAGADTAATPSGVYAAAWALLALRNDSDRPAMQAHLEWLQLAAHSSRGPASLAMAQLALRACGRRLDSLEARLARLHNSNQFLCQTAVVAAAGLALSPLPAWAVRQASPMVARAVLLQRV